MLIRGTKKKPTASAVSSSPKTGLPFNYCNTQPVISKQRIISLPPAPSPLALPPSLTPQAQHVGTRLNEETHPVVVAR